MSLIDIMTTACVYMVESKVSDGEGGYTTSWTAGDPIKVAITHDTTTQARIAEKEGVTSLYTLTTSKDNTLKYHDVIKRLSDNAIFRVTSNSEDKTSPSIASLNMAQVTAERWVLPT